MSKKSTESKQKKVTSEEALLAVKSIMLKLEIVEKYCKQEFGGFKGLKELSHWSGVMVAAGEIRGAAKYIWDFILKKKGG